MHHLGIYIANGLVPSHQVTMNFNHKRRIQSTVTVQKHSEDIKISRILACVDPAEITPPRKTHPNWKVQKFLGGKSLLLSNIFIWDKDSMWMSRQEVVKVATQTLY